MQPIDQPFAKMEIALSRTTNRTDPNVLIPDQCHSSTIIEIVTGNEDLSQCDALITKRKDISIGVVTADCIPLCIADTEKIAVVHAGWRGVCADIIEKSLARFGSVADEIWVGPFIKSFVVQPDECMQLLQAKFGTDFFITTNEEIRFDFEAAVRSILPTQTIFDGRDTFTDMNLPSYRRDKTNIRIVTAVKRR